MPSVFKNFQSFSDLAGILALFEVDDEPYSGSGGQSEVPLRDTQALAGLADEFANLLGCISQVICQNLPYGNIKPNVRQTEGNITVREHTSRNGEER